MELTYNFKKHTSKNLLHRYLLNNYFHTLIDLVKTLPVKTILDVGCGEGFTLNRLEKAGIGKTLEGVDFLDDAIALGKKAHPRLLLKKGDIYDLKYPDNCFDLVLCNEVMEHLDNAAGAYKEILRVSKKYVLISVPHEPFFTMQRLARAQNLKRLGFHPEHINLWSYFGFKRFLKREPVHILAKKYPFPWQMALIEKK